MRLIDWLKSRRGENFRLVLDTAVGLMLFLWLLKGRK